MNDYDMGNVIDSFCQRYEGISSGEGNGFTPKPKRDQCKYCGKPGLHWESYHNKKGVQYWQLTDEEGNPHFCDREKSK